MFEYRKCFSGGACDRELPLLCGSGYSQAELSMSLASKVTLGVACATTIGIIAHVHFKQSLDKERLHEGIILDIERQQRRKIENLYLLQQQSDLRRQLKQQEVIALEENHEST